MSRLPSLLARFATALVALALLSACGSTPHRPVWWSEPFAYEQLLPQWPEQTAEAIGEAGASEVVASRSVVRDGGLVVDVERSGDVALVSARVGGARGACSVEFECHGDACAPVSRTWFVDDRVEGYDFLVASGEPWARFENRYDDDGLFLGTDAIRPDGKRDVYADRTFDPDAGRVLTLWPTTGCGHEVQLDDALRPVSARGYCQQQLTEEESFRYDERGQLAAATVRYGADAAPVTYTLDWAPELVTLSAASVGTTIEIRPAAPTYDLPSEVRARAPEICAAGTPPHAWEEPQ